VAIIKHNYNTVQAVGTDDHFLCSCYSPITEFERL